MSEVHRRIFPETFKREAVARVSSGVPAGQVAAELGVHTTVLRRWVRQYAVASAAASAPRLMGHAMTPSLADLTAENTRLRRENDRLRMERDILKKTVTIFGAGAK
jgi:transposase